MQDLLFDFILLSKLFYDGLFLLFRAWKNTNANYVKNLSVSFQISLNTCHASTRGKVTNVCSAPFALKNSEVNSDLAITWSKLTNKRAPTPAKFAIRATISKGSSIDILRAMKSLTKLSAKFACYIFQGYQPCKNILESNMKILNLSNVTSVKKAIAWLSLWKVTKQLYTWVWKTSSARSAIKVSGRKVNWLVI